MLVQGLQGPRQEPIIFISWSLWVSINSAWRDESFELGNRSVAPLFPEKNVSSTRRGPFDKGLNYKIPTRTTEKKQ